MAEDVIGEPKVLFWCKVIEVVMLLAQANHPPCRCVMHNTKFRKNITMQINARVNLLTYKRLTLNLGTLSIWLSLRFGVTWSEPIDLILV